MYVIYGNIYHQYTPNVSIYTIHGSYGICKDPHMFFEFCIAPPGPPIPHPVQVPNPSAPVAPKLPAKPPGVPTGSRSAQRSCLWCVSHEKQNTVGGARHEETRTVANLGTFQYIPSGEIGVPVDPQNQSFSVFFSSYTLVFLVTFPVTEVVACPVTGRLRIMLTLD